MPSEVKNFGVGSMSAEQLAEKLEKSEAGRKKLRQAISILQQKLDATDKVLKINETLRQECERERQRAEEEKRKADEEKKIRFAVEKDSSTLKEQLGKVLQRLGVVENRQKSDKKEIDRLRAEVKLAVDGSRAAAQAGDAVQNSLQCLETTLPVKVSETLQRVDAVSQELHSVQNSVQSLGKRVSEITELVTKPALHNEVGNQLQVSEALQRVDAVSQELHSVQNSVQSLGKKVSERTELVTKPALHNEVENQLEESEDKKLNISRVSNKPEKLVDSVMHHFFKGKKSHLKMERKLAALKGLLKRSRNDEFLSNFPVDLPSKDLQSSKRRRVDGFEKPSSVQDAGNASSKSRKKRRRIQKEYNSNCLSRKSVEREDQIRNDKITRFLDVSKIPGKPDRPESMLQNTSKAYLCDRTSNEHIEYELSDGGGLLKGNCCDGLKSLVENPETILVDCHQKCMSGKDNLNIRLHGEESARLLQPTKVSVNESEEHLEFSSGESELELDWLPGEMTLLSPNLPELASPLCDSPFAIKDPSNDGVCTAITPELVVGQNHVALQKDEVLVHIRTHTCVGMPDQQGAFEHSESFIQNGKERTTFSSSNSSLHFGCISNVEGKLSLESRDQTALGTDVGQQSGLIKWDYERITGRETRVTDQVQINQSKQDEVLIKTTLPSVACNRDGCLARQEQSVESLNETFPWSSCLSEPKSDICNTSERTEDKCQDCKEDFGFDAVDYDIIKETKKFLEDLPSISCASANQIPSNLSEFSPENQVIEEGSLKSCGNLCLSAKETFGDSFTASVKGASAQELNALIKSTYNQGGDTQPEMRIEGKTQSNNRTEGNAQPEIRTDLPIVSDKSNIVAGYTGSQLSEKSSCQHVLKQSSSLIPLLQGFDLHVVENEAALAKAAVVARIVKRYLSCSGLNCQQTELQRALISFSTNQKLPIEYTACSLISSVVDIVSLESKGECSFLRATSFSSLLQTFAALIGSVFKEDATAIFNIIFAQLTRFLNEGSMIFVAFQAVECLKEEIFVSDDLMQCNNLLSCGISRATLEDVHAGSKVLAGLCQILSCVSHLQTVVYEVLGCCDKDTTWLLTIFSSFASICGHCFFILGPDDLLGNTICAIVLELVSNADQDCVKGLKIIEQALTSSADIFQMPEEWESVKGDPRIKGKCSLEAAIFSVLMAFYDILFLTNDLPLPGSQMVLKDSLLCTGEKLEGPIPRQDVITNVPDKPHSKVVIACDDVDMPETAAEQRVSMWDINELLSAQSRDKETSETVTRRQDFMHLSRAEDKSVILDWKKWQRKYCEVIRALELIALYMGWEWTYNDLIVGHLWQMVVSGSAKICVAVISHIIGILGRFGMGNDRKELHGIEELKASMVFVLHSKTTTMATSDNCSFSLFSQAAAAHSLVKLNNVSCTKSKDSNRVGPNLQEGNSPISSSHMKFLKEWLHGNGFETQRTLPKFLKSESAISELLTS